MTTTDDRLAHVEQSVLELRTELQKFRLEASRDAADTARSLERILATLDALQRRPSFRWPWESR